MKVIVSLFVTIFSATVAGCFHRSSFDTRDWSARVADIRPGTSSEAAREQLGLGAYPVRSMPASIDARVDVYFLPSGDVHVGEKMNSDDRPVIASIWFVPQKNPVEARLKNWDEQWDKYVKAHTGR